MSLIDTRSRGSAETQQTTEEWRQRYRSRAGAEATISQVVRHTSVRHSRYTGTAKTHLGHVFAATAVNIVRVDAWLAGAPIGPTRTSHLARLATQISLNSPD